MSDLGTFEGKPVVATGIEIPNAAGGLNKALALDPAHFEQGEELTVALRVIVEKVRHDPADKDVPDGEQVRVHIAPTHAAAILEGDALDRSAEQIDAVQQKVDEHEARIATERHEAKEAKKRAKEAAKAEAKEAKRVGPGQGKIEDVVGSEKITVPNVTPIDKKAQGAKKAPAKRAAKKAAPRKARTTKRPTH